MGIIVDKIILSMYTEIEIIRTIIEIYNKLAKLPTWRWISRYLLKRQIKIAKQGFLNREIFTQLEALFLIMQQIPIKKMPYGIFFKSNYCLVFLFDYQYKGKLRTGRMQYTLYHDPKLFIEIAHTKNKSDGLIFSIYHNTTLTNELQEYWKGLCLPVLLISSEELLDTIIASCTKGRDKNV